MCRHLAPAGSTGSWSQSPTDTEGRCTWLLFTVRMAARFSGHSLLGRSSGRISERPASVCAQAISTGASELWVASSGLGEDTRAGPFAGLSRKPLYS